MSKCWGRLASRTHNLLREKMAMKKCSRGKSQAVLSRAAWVWILLSKFIDSSKVNRLHTSSVVRTRKRTTSTRPCHKNAWEWYNRCKLARLKSRTPVTRSDRQWRDSDFLTHGECSCFTSSFYFTRQHCNMSLGFCKTIAIHSKDQGNGQPIS